MNNQSEQPTPQSKKPHKSKKEKKIHLLSIRRRLSKLSLYMVKSSGNLIPASTASTPKAGEPSEAVELKQYSFPKSDLKKVNHHKTLLTLCRFPELMEQSETAAKLMLLVFMSQTLHLMVESLPALPILILDCPPQIANTIIGPLLNAIQGPQIWSGTGWYVQRPWIIRPQMSLGETTVSKLIMDYLGGNLRDWNGKKRSFYFPFIASSMVLMPGLPATVSKQIINLSPLAIPIVLEQWKASGARPILNLNDCPLNVYDTNGLEELEQSANHCHMQIMTFLRWFCGKAKHIEHWKKDIERFRPVVRKGRFIQPKSDEQTEFMCAALSFFLQFLRYASEKALWITKEEAQEILLRYWRWVLPDSATAEEVQSTNGQENSLPICYHDSQVFYQFLTDCFLPTYQNQILIGAKGVSGTMAIIRKLDGEDWFITPRKQFLKIYARWLSERRAPTFESGSGAEVQRQLQEAGIPLRGESGNPVTWRYSFYADRKDKVDCLALPIESLPEWVKTVFGDLIGIPSDTEPVPTQSESALDGQKEVEVL